MSNILPIVIISLLVLSVVFFSMESPYWYASILTFSLVILIILIKIMWGVAGWATDKVHEFIDKEKD